MATKNSINNKTQDLTIDPGSSGDAFTQYSINGTSEFRIGVDDDAGDSFKISQGSALGTNDCLVITAAGEVTMPLTPAFLAVVTSQKSGVTGDNTVYGLTYDSEIFDQNNDFNGSTTFTAPITGRYMFEFGLTVEGVVSGHTGGFVRLQTSNRNYINNQFSWAAMDNASTQVATSFSIMADMDASDTAFLDIQVGNSTKSIDIITNGATDPYNWFSGSLQC